MVGLRSVSLNNVIYMTGGWDGEAARAEILRWDPTEEVSCALFYIIPKDLHVHQELKKTKYYRKTGRIRFIGPNREGGVRKNPI